MIKKKAIYPLLFSLCFSPLLCAQSIKSNPSFQSLQQKINNKNFESAWETAQFLKEEWLGDTSFDFLYGVAALTNNQAEHAVFAFERVTANQPNWLDAHYLLAKSNYAIANYQATIDGSKFLLGNPNTSEKLKEASKALIDSSNAQLNKQSLYVSQRISLGLGYDSNVNSGTTEDDIFLPSLGQSIMLSEESKEQSDNYAALSYQVSGSKTFSQVSKIVFSGKGTVNRFKDETDYDRMYADINVKYQHTFNFAQLAVGVKWTPLWLNDDFYRTRTAFTTDLEKQLSKKWSLTAGVEFSQIKNKINNNFDTNGVSTNLFTHYFSGNLKHSFGVNYTDEKSDMSDQNHNSYKLSTLSYSNLWLINKNWIAQGMVAYQEKEYQDLQPTFLEERNDDMWLGSLSIQYIHSKAWSYSFNVNAQNKDSNVSLFSYQRSDISLTANMNF